MSQITGYFWAVVAFTCFLCFAVIITNLAISLHGHYHFLRNSTLFSNKLLFLQGMKQILGNMLKCKRVSKLGVTKLYSNIMDNSLSYLGISIP